MLKKFAEELKDARLKKDISLQQISTKTRIDIRFLEAIENGNYEILPEVYLKAFIRSYAASVGLDENTTMKKFEAAKSGKNIDERNIPEVPEPRKEEHVPGRKEYITSESAPAGNEDEEDSSSRPSRNNILLLVLGLGLIVVIIIAYLVFFNSSSTDIVTEKPYDEIVKENKQRYEEQQEDSVAAPDTTQTAVTNPAASAPVVPNDSLNLVIKAKDSTWIRVSIDNDARVRSFTLPPNSQRLVRAKTNFRVHVGNAGNIEMSLNNKSLNFAGKRGEVKAVKVDTSGLHYITLIKTPAKTQ